MMTRTLGAAFLALAVTGPWVAGQAQEPATMAQPMPVFRAQADLVVLHVNVFDKGSNAVSHLPQSAFHVIDNGEPQEIAFFSDTDVPVAVGLVVDNSTSMLTRQRMVLAGAHTFAESSHPEDEVFTISFNEHVRFGLPESVPFTTSRSLIQAGLNRFAPGGLTALHDAVFDGLEHLQTATHQKRVLVVLSDGEDNASRRSEADMLRRAARSDALIYTISTADVTMRSGNNGLLRRLAQASGGAAYFPRTEADVVQAFTQVATNIRHGYSIGYVPATNDVSDDYHHRVTVLVRVPGKAYTVRVRDGYERRSPDAR